MTDTASKEGTWIQPCPAGCSSKAVSELLRAATGRVPEFPGEHRHLPLTRAAPVPTALLPGFAGSKPAAPTFPREENMPKLEGRLFIAFYRWGMALPRAVQGQE